MKKIYGGIVLANLLAVILIYGIWEAKVNLPDGVVAYWNMDENSGTVIHDSCNNYNRGTIRGAGWVVGVSGSALSFSKSEDVVVIPEGTLGKFPDGASEITVSVWIFPRSAPSTEGRHRPIIRGLITLDQCLAEPWKAIMSSFGKTQYKDGIPPRYYHRDRTCCKDVIRLNEWNHIVTVYNGKDVEIYANGFQVEDEEHGGQGYGEVNIMGKFSLWIGGEMEGEFFDGFIDEVVIYNRTLSVNEIYQQYLKYKLANPYMIFLKLTLEKIKRIIGFKELKEVYWDLCG